MKISPADKWFSMCVREAADNVCAVCGEKKDRTETSHIFGRRHRTVRWCKENALCKCHGCHRWWHERPTESGNWFREKYGAGIEEILYEKIHSRQKVPKTEEKEIAAHYRKEHKKLLEIRATGKKGQLDFESWQ